MFLKILTVAALATFEIYAAIPAGFAFGLSPLVIFFASVTGGITGAFVTTFLGDKIRKLFSKNKKTGDKKPNHPILYKVWTKYGSIGLGFLGSFFLGAPISIAVGIGLNAEPKKLLLWCCVGIFSRCLTLTLLGHFGLKLF